MCHPQPPPPLIPHPIFWVEADYFVSRYSSGDIYGDVVWSLLVEGGKPLQLSNNSLFFLTFHPLSITSVSHVTAYVSPKISLHSSNPHLP